MAEDLGERTEEATPRRRQEARAEGNVARSPDLASALLLLALTCVAWLGARTMLLEGCGLLERALGDDGPGEWIGPEGMLPALVAQGWAGARLVAPILAIALGVAAMAHLVQIGWLFAPAALRPSLSRLSPASGFRRILGVRGMVKAGIDVTKVALVASIAVAIVLYRAPRIVTLSQLPMTESLPVVGRLLLELALAIAAVLVVLGIIDYALQRWRHSRDLRMTRQQVQDELKQTEGDPEIKRRRMRLMHQMAMQRLNAAVPKADVVVTNPEHVAVAIRYDAATMRAPRVVAKGADLLAIRIRQLALRHAIPIVERKPLARALYKSVEVNQEIPPQFYHAVAEILAYVYRLNGRGVA
jgi:flagellar biosynthetic protein FlhB